MNVNRWGAVAAVAVLTATGCSSSSTSKPSKAATASQTLAVLKTEIATVLPDGCWTTGGGDIEGAYEQDQFYTNSFQVTDDTGDDTPDPTGTACSGEYANSNSDEIDFALYLSPSIASHAAHTLEGIDPARIEALYVDQAVGVTVFTSSKPATVTAVGSLPGLRQVWTHA